MDIGKKRVLVTGADGFIGSHLVEQLVRRGAQVRALVFYNAFNSCGWLDSLDEDVRGAIQIVAGDIRDPGGVREAVWGIDVILHLAALIGIPFSYHSPDAYVQTNIGGTLNILQAGRDAGVEKIVHTSTSEAYGTAQFVPITEAHPMHAQSPYAATKIGADQLALSFFRCFETPVAVARPFNAYGPRQSARAVIPTIISQLASGAKQVKLGSLKPTRDFCFVADTARAFIAVAESDRTMGEVVHFGSGFEIAVGDLAETIGRLMDVPLEVKSDEERLRPQNSEVGRLWCDFSRARELTGWEPQYAGREGLEQGLKETIAWFTDPANLSRYKPFAYNI
jgi:NAD dependent epimerase/dehydratase